MNQDDPSVENGKKLDEVIQLLRGSGPDAPGLLHAVARHNSVLYGTNGYDGLVSRVAIMWRVHVSVLVAAGGALGTGFGFLLKSALIYISKNP